jgi:hypothetical protein
MKPLSQSGQSYSVGGLLGQQKNQVILALHGVRRKGADRHRHIGKADYTRSVRVKSGNLGSIRIDKVHVHALFGKKSA